MHHMVKIGKKLRVSANILMPKRKDYIVVPSFADNSKDTTSVRLQVNKITRKSIHMLCTGCCEMEVELSLPDSVCENEFDFYEDKCKPKEEKGIAYILLGLDEHNIVWVVPKSDNAMENRLMIQPLVNNIRIWSDIDMDDVNYDDMRILIEDAKIVNKFYKKHVKESLE